MAGSMNTNGLKTLVLLALLTAIVLWIGTFWGTTGIVFAAIIVVLINVASIFWSDKITLSIYHAKEASDKEHRELHQMVQEVSQQAGLPKPKVYVIPSNNMNAFATGRSYKHSSIAFTKGILERLSRSELKGVTAHEMAHIKNRDILISSVAAMIAGIISYVATMAQWAAIFGGFGGRDNDGGGLIQLLVLIILAPIIALIIRMAISRTREYSADATGAKIIRNPYGLADALEKLERDPYPMRMGNQATEHLFISNPFKGRNMIKLFSTHPPTAERVKKLRGMRV